MFYFQAVHPSKDVDGFHVLNMGRLYGNRSSLMPATPSGIVELIRRLKIETFGKTAVVVGRSKNVGLPMAMLMHSDGVFRDCPGLDATVTICHRYTPPDVLKQMTSTADIIVVAVVVECPKKSSTCHCRLTWHAVKNIYVKSSDS